MNAEQLKNKWALLKYQEQEGKLKALRISAECIAELYIGTDENGLRCLIMFLPQALDFNPRRTQKQNLSIEYLKEEMKIVIRLNDDYFVDLFDDLVISLHNSIRDVVDPKEYSRLLIATFHKWSELFENRTESQLSREIIQGLIGEMLILRDRVADADNHDVDSILESWTGPYDRGNDFVFNDGNLEVKTRLVDTPVIRISSEHQLQDEPDKFLHLVVVTVEKDAVHGLSILDLMKMLRREIRQKFGDVSIMLRALSQKGLGFENADRYDDQRYRAICHNTFDCNLPNFPRIIATELHNEITGVSYMMRVGMLEPFEIESKSFENAS